MKRRCVPEPFVSPSLTPFLGLALLDMAKPAAIFPRALSMVPLEVPERLDLGRRLLALLVWPLRATFCLATVTLRIGFRHGLRNLSWPWAARLTVRRGWFRCRRCRSGGFGGHRRRDFHLMNGGFRCHPSRSMSRPWADRLTARRGRFRCRCCRPGGFGGRRHRDFHLRNGGLWCQLS